MKLPAYMDECSPLAQRQIRYLQARIERRSPRARRHLEGEGRAWVRESWRQVLRNRLRRMYARFT